MLPAHASFLLARFADRVSHTQTSPALSVHSTARRRDLQRDPRPVASYRPQVSTTRGNSAALPSSIALRHDQPPANFAAFDSPPPDGRQSAERNCASAACSDRNEMLPESDVRTARAPRAPSLWQSPLHRCVPKEPRARSPAHPIPAGSPPLPGDESPSASALAIAWSGRSPNDLELQSGLGSPMPRSPGPRFADPRSADQRDTPHNPTHH